MAMGTGAAPSLADEKKRRAGVEAASEARDGMLLGLGTGSTVQFALEEISRLVKSGLKVRGVPTSRRTEAEARRLGIPLATLEDAPQLDLTIDGADELDARLNLIKGGGAALLREKVVASVSMRVLIIADDTKLVEPLGSTFAVPVEIVPFARATVQPRLEGLGAKVAPRQKDGQAVVTDNGGWILDARFPGLKDPRRTEHDIGRIPGVWCCGIFTGLAHEAILGTETGTRRVRPPA